MLGKLFKRGPKTGIYEGEVCFSENSHYPVVDGQGVFTQRLLWKDGAYHWATPEDPMHRHLYERDVVELPVQQ